MDLFRRIEWRLYKEARRARLRNRTPTIIASNCIGTFIYYDMKLRFNSPTINLSFDMNDYVRFLERLPYYLEQMPIQADDKRFPYPCAMIDDVEVRFNHYPTFEKAVAKWEERKRRVDLDNLYVIGIDGDGCTYDTLLKFDALPYAHKVIFTHKPYPDIKSAFYLPGFEEKGEIVRATDFIDAYRIRRYTDAFDYVSFLNAR